MNPLKWYKKRKVRRFFEKYQSKVVSKKTVYIGDDKLTEIKLESKAPIAKAKKGITGL